jgi:LDH2 family malate/lactate/ureidoglycolate dehydrogenase
MPKRLSGEQWVETCRRVFTSWGAPDDIAGCVARSLVGSDLAGVSSHGVMRIPSYHRFLRAGWLDPAARPEVVRESAASALVESHWGFGQVAFWLAVELAIAKSKECGIAGVGVTHSGHAGRLGEYVEYAAQKGVIAIVMVSNGRPGGPLAPHGGAQRVLGTNPLAAGSPAGNHPPFVMDFATSAVAAGKLELLRGQAIPEGWVLNIAGEPARTADEYFEGGALLPFGGHKGYGLAMLVEMLSGGLTGAGITERPGETPTQGAGGNPGFVIALDIAQYTDPTEYARAVDAFFARLHGVTPAPRSGGVLIPGEIEERERARHRAEGIEVSDAVWDSIRAVADEHGVSLHDIA